MPASEPLLRVDRVGKNGAGKSTLTRVITGALPVNRGTLRDSL